MAMNNTFTIFGNIVTKNTHAYMHDDVIKWKHFPRYWPFVRGIHRSPVNSPHKGQWRGALMFTLICARINGWVNNREAGDLRRYRTHYDVIVMWLYHNDTWFCPWISTTACFSNRMVWVCHRFEARSRTRLISKRRYPLDIPYGSKLCRYMLGIYLLSVDMVQLIFTGPGYYTVVPT